MFVYSFPFGPLRTNAILIGCDQQKVAAVIDPSLGSCQALLQKAKELGCKIEKILLTHSHWDHFADASPLKKQTGAPLLVHAFDAKNIENPGSDRLPLFVSIDPVVPDQLLHGGETIEVGNLKLEVIHTPGHSPGGVCFYLRKEHLLISGDTLFRGGMGNLSLPTAEPDLMRVSLQKLAQLPPETRVIPGHGMETSIGAEEWLFDTP